MQWLVVMSSVYRLTADEVEVAKLIGERRNRLTFGGSNLPVEHATKETRLDQDCRGAAAEIAVSRYFNLCWTGCGKGSEGLFDVGNCLQVRSVSDSFRGLLVRPRDVLHHPCVLVQVDADYTCTLLGWEYQETVKKNGWKLDPNSTKPCWILGRGKLKALDNCPLQFRLEGMY